MFLITKFLIAFGIISVFQGASKHFEAHAKESSSTAGGSRCDTVGGGRSIGCGRSA